MYEVPDNLKTFWGNLRGFKCYSICFGFKAKQNPCKTRECYAEKPPESCKCDKVEIYPGVSLCDDGCVKSSCPRHCYKFIDMCKSECGNKLDCGPESGCMPGNTRLCTTNETSLVCIRDLTAIFTPWIDPADPTTTTTTPSTTTLATLPTQASVYPTEFKTPPPLSTTQVPSPKPSHPHSHLAVYIIIGISAISFLLIMIGVICSMIRSRSLVVYSRTSTIGGSVYPSHVRSGVSRIRGSDRTKSQSSRSRRR